MPYEQNLYGNQFLGMQGLPIMPEMYGAQGFMGVPPMDNMYSGYGYQGMQMPI